MQIKTLLAVAFGSLLLVACSEEYFFIPVGTASGPTCPADAYCLDVSELTVNTAYYNLTTVSDSRGPDSYYQVVT